MQRQSGFTLIEMLVVVTIITLLVAIGLPAFRALSRSFETGDSVLSMIDAALASARAVAMREDRYAGVRFQKVYHPDGPLKASQYMILIVHDFSDGSNETDLKYGFRALAGVKPIKLPDSVGVMDLSLAIHRDDKNPVKSTFQRIDELPDTENKDTYLDHPNALRDVTTFSVLFSPQGQLVMQGVRVRNRDDIGDVDSELNNNSADDVFNKKDQVESGVGMFFQDDYFGTKREDLGLGPEASRTSFIVYDRLKFAKAYKQHLAWTGYLAAAHQRYYINRYTGTIIGQPAP